MVSIVIPVYQSKHTLRSVVEEVLAQTESWIEDIEIILVDDHSQDGTRDLVRALVKQYAPVKAIYNETTCGQQETLLRGLNQASGEWLVTMDDDGQHPVSMLDDLLNSVKQGYDLVYCVCSKPKEETWRRSGAMMRDMLFRQLYPFLGDLRVSSYRILTRSLHQCATKIPRKFTYLSCLYLQHRPRVGNIPMDYQKRLHGKSNYPSFALALLLVKIAFWYGLAAKWNVIRKKKRL